MVIPDQFDRLYRHSKYNYFLDGLCECVNQYHLCHCFSSDPGTSEIYIRIAQGPHSVVNAVAPVVTAGWQSREMLVFLLTEDGK